MNQTLELKNVTKKYADFTLSNISFTLPSGCIMGLIGENGSGKSTTIKLILDLIKKDAGEIFLFGKKFSNQDKQIKEKIGVVFEESGFPENLSAKDVNTIMKNTYKNWEEDKFLNYIKLFSLSFQKKIKQYSRGMKMKLSIAVALSHNSQLLVLDEATSGLDPLVRDEILDIFLEFIQNENHSILISSHIVSDLEKICDYITFIHKGKIVFTEIKDNLLDKYGLLKCSEKEFRGLDEKLVKGYRKNSFGVEALVEKSLINKEFIMDKASIEDIMLFMGKERVS